MAHKTRFYGTIMQISRALGGGAARSVAILGLALSGCALALTCGQLFVTATEPIRQRVQFQFDAFYAYLEGRDNGSDARAEILVQF